MGKDVVTKLHHTGTFGKAKFYYQVTNPKT